MRKRILATIIAFSVLFTLFQTPVVFAKQTKSKIVKSTKSHVTKTSKSKTTKSNSAKAKAKKTTKSAKTKQAKSKAAKAKTTKSKTTKTKSTKAKSSKTKKATKKTSKSKTTGAKKTARPAAKKPASRDGSVNSSASKIISYGMSLIGTPYKYTGRSPKGFDCSGFTSYVFDNAVGISLPHSSRDQARMGTSVEKSELRPGDIVYFNTNGSGVSHVGIYIGDNKFMHASTNRGVTLTSLSESYYVKRYMGARRIL